MPVCNPCSVSVLFPAGYIGTYSSGGGEPSTSIAKHYRAKHTDHSTMEAGMGTCDALLTLSHHLQVALDKGMEEKFVQLEFSTGIDIGIRCIS